MCMIKMTKKCPCGCEEKHRRLDIGQFFVWYFEDCGEWWFRIGTPWKVFSYSPCQGWMKYRRDLFK